MFRYCILVSKQHVADEFCLCAFAKEKPRSVCYYNLKPELRCLKEKAGITAGKFNLLGVRFTWLVRSGGCAWVGT